MKLNFYLAASFLIGSTKAADCRVPTNFPTALRVGQVYPLIQTTTTSPDRRFNTTISGNILVLSSCSLQLTDLTLQNAPASASIQLYGIKDTGRGYPISPQILSGEFTNENGPVFTFSDTTFFLIPGSPGIAWSDFSVIRVFSVASSWTVAQVVLPNFVDLAPNGTSSVGTSATPTSRPGNVPTNRNIVSSACLNSAFLSQFFGAVLLWMVLT